MKYRFLNVGLRGFSLAIKSFLILFLATFLTPEEVGLYGLITVTVSYSIYFLGFEFYTFSTRDLVARPKYEWPRLLSTQIIFFGLMYLIMLPLFSLIFMFDLMPMEHIISLLTLMVLEHLSAELIRLLVVMEKPLQATIIIFIKQGGWAACFIIVMLVEPAFRSIDMLLLFWIGGVTAAIVIGLRPLAKLDWRCAGKKTDWKWVKRGVLIAFPLLISSIAIRALFTFDRYTFEALNGFALLGAYSVYMSIASVMLVFMESAVFVYFYPEMMKAYKKRDFIGFRLVYKKLVKQSLIWMVILLGFLSIAAPVIFSMVKEKIYADNIVLFYVILFAISLLLIGYIYQYGLYTTSRDKSIIIANLAGLVVATGVLVIAASYTRYWAVPIAMIVGSLVATLIKYREWVVVKREFNKY